MATSPAPIATTLTHLVIFLLYLVEKQRFKHHEPLLSEGPLIHPHPNNLFLDICHDLTGASLCTMASGSPETAPNAVQGTLTEEYCHG